MAHETHTVYQSGDSVPATGVYEVAGAEHEHPSPIATRRGTGELESPVRELTAGDTFPNYKGRAVMWHLRQPMPQ